jgi:O-antigen/teichoic acid export membrane protein
LQVVKLKPIVGTILYLAAQQLFLFRNQRITLSSIKKLAGQTLWYGLSSIFGRFLNYLLTPILTYAFGGADFGIITVLFTIAGFLNIFYTYGMETSYFRFSNMKPEADVFNTAVSSIFITTAVFTGALLLFSSDLARFYEIPEQRRSIVWVLAIVALDTLCVMPFAKLRFENRPRKYAFIKVINICINVGLVIFFLVICKNQHQKNPDSWIGRLYSPETSIGYVILANLIASALTLVLLAREFMRFRFKLNIALWKEIMQYSWPLIIVGFGGMVNELIDRTMIQKLYEGTTREAYAQAGIYSANYKLAVLIVLFIQAFRMGAEPFFFKQAGEKNPQRTYARVMKFFILACCFCFLGVTLFLDIWKHFMSVGRHPEYLQGLFVVPILMIAKIFLGAYYNLSIWYKITNRNLTGAWITLGGALITVVVNWIFIPYWGYAASAVATVLCYGFMMVTCYRLGQKHYPVPYAWKKMTAYVVICLLLFGVHQLIRHFSPAVWFTHLAALALLTAFGWFVVNVERKEFANIPYLKKLIRTKPELKA